MSAPLLAPIQRGQRGAAAAEPGIRFKSSDPLSPPSSFVPRSAPCQQGDSDAGALSQIAVAVVGAAVGAVVLVALCAAAAFWRRRLPCWRRQQRRSAVRPVHDAPAPPKTDKYLLPSADLAVFIYPLPQAPSDGPSPGASEGGDLLPSDTRTGPRRVSRLSSGSMASLQGDDAADSKLVFVELRGMRVTVVAVGHTAEDGPDSGLPPGVSSRIMPREMQRAASFDGQQSVSGAFSPADFIGGNTPRQSVTSQRRVSRPSMVLVKSPSRSTLIAMAAGRGTGLMASTESQGDASNGDGGTAWALAAASTDDGGRPDRRRSTTNSEAAGLDPLERWLGLDVARPLYWTKTNLVELCDLRHPNIVSTFGGSLLYGRQVLVEECLELGSLADVLADSVRPRSMRMMRGAPEPRALSRFHSAMEPAAGVPQLLMSRSHPCSVRFLGSLGCRSCIWTFPPCPGWRRG